MTYACARCGKRQPAEKMVFSKHTRARYCVDLDACQRRAAKRRKSQTVPLDPMGAAA